MEPVTLHIAPNLVLETRAFILWVGYAWLAILYFAPGIVAWRRRHRNTLAIVVLNIFAGWSVLGWIGALVWACTANTLKSSPEGRLPE